MSTSLITGIDIGHHSIKAIVLKPAKGSLTLSHYREIMVSDVIFTDNHLLNYQEIVNKLKELKKGLPFFSRKVALSIPDNSVISKLIQVDKYLSAQEMEYAIFEAFSHQSPFEVEELSIDYSFTSLVNSSDSLQPVQVYATKKEVVDNRIDVCNKVGFTPCLLDVQAHSLVRVWQAIAQMQQKNNWLLLDVGHTHSTMVFDFPNKAPLCRELPIGGQSLRDESGNPHSVSHDATHQFIASLVDRVQRQIHLLASVEDINFEGIWVTGGGANTPMLLEELTRNLNLRCELFDPFSLFNWGDKRNRRERCHGYSYTLATGLALRGLDWMEQRHAS